MPFGLLPLPQPRALDAGCCQPGPVRPPLRCHQPLHCHWHRHCHRRRPIHVTPGLRSLSQRPTPGAVASPATPSPPPAPPPWQSAAAPPRGAGLRMQARPLRTGGAAAAARRPRRRRCHLPALGEAQWWSSLTFRSSGSGQQWFRAAVVHGGSDLGQWWFRAEVV